MDVEGGMIMHPGGTIGAGEVGFVMFAFKILSGFM